MYTQSLKDAHRSENSSIMGGPTDLNFTAVISSTGMLKPIQTAQ